MRNLLIFILLTLFCACQEDKSAVFSLRGDVRGLKDSVLYFYPAFGEPDTLLRVQVEDGKFSLTLPVDTLCPFLLYAEGLGQEVPVFADKGVTAVLEGDTGRVTVKGGNAQDIYNDFFSLAMQAPDEETVRNLADSFITRYPHSEVSLYLVDAHFVQIPHPNKDLIDRMLNRLSGRLQDNPYVAVLRNRASGVISYGHNETLPVVSLPDSLGKMVSGNMLKENFVIVCLWASWHETSRAKLKSLQKLANAYAKKPVLFLNVSLDTDRAAWIEAIRTDTLPGVHVCDGKGWSGTFVRQVGAGKLPFNLVRNPQNRVIATDMWGKSLDAFLEKQLALKQKKLN